MSWPGAWAYIDCIASALFDWPSVCRELSKLLKKRRPTDISKAQAPGSADIFSLTQLYDPALNLFKTAKKSILPNTMMMSQSAKYLKWRNQASMQKFVKLVHISPKSKLLLAYSSKSHINLQNKVSEDQVFKTLRSCNLRRFLFLIKQETWSDCLS